MKKETIPNELRIKERKKKRKKEREAKKDKERQRKTKKDKERNIGDKNKPICTANDPT